jgi:hypothetical protein
MSPRQIGAYLYFATINKRHDLGIFLNLHAIAAQGDGKDIKSAGDKLMAD